MSTLADYQNRRDAIAQLYQSRSQEFDGDSFASVYIARHNRATQSYDYTLIEPQPFIDYDPPQEEAIAESRSTGIVNRVRINGLTSTYSRSDLEGIHLVIGDPLTDGKVYEIENLELNTQRTTWTVTLIQKTTEQNYRLF